LSEVAADDIEDVLVNDRGAADIAADGVAFPELFAILGIEAAQAVGAVEDDFLGAFRGFDDHGGGPAIAEHACAPDDFTSVLVQGKEGARLNRGIDEDEVAMNGRAGAAAEGIAGGADVALPDFLAVEVEAEHAAAAIVDVD